MNFGLPYGVKGSIRISGDTRHLRALKALKQLTRRDLPLINLQVDPSFLVEVLLISTVQKLPGAVHQEQRPPKFISNTDFTKGVLCPEKSIRSIRNRTLR